MTVAPIFVLVTIEELVMINVTYNVVEMRVLIVQIGNDVLCKLASSL